MCLTRHSSRPLLERRWRFLPGRARRINYRVPLYLPTTTTRKFMNTWSNNQGRILHQNRQSHSLPPIAAGSDNYAAQVKQFRALRRGDVSREDRLSELGRESAAFDSPSKRSLGRLFVINFRLNVDASRRRSLYSLRLINWRSAVVIFACPIARRPSVYRPAAIAVLSGTLPTDGARRESSQIGGDKMNNDRRWFVSSARKCR